MNRMAARVWLIWATLIAAGLGVVPAGAAEEKKLEEDVIKAEQGDLKITFIGHGTLMFTWQNKVIHVDPVTREVDYTKLPKADLVLITHEHG
ncbi:MAG TPA: MBL fold metallo-hydrolase, partial [Sedimentisphaerales bacterium]|nr:MBL fold metallo-hydrolase [Sedimentisphaerales bacterium]